MEIYELTPQTQRPRFINKSWVINFMNECVKPSDAFTGNALIKILSMKKYFKLQNMEFVKTIQIIQFHLV